MNFDQCIENGKKALSRNAYKEAEDYFRAAIKLDENSVWAHDGLIDSLQGQDKLTEALQCCDNALKLNPLNALAHTQKVMRESTPETPLNKASLLEVCDQLLKQAVTPANLFARGYAYFLNDQYREAEADLLQAINQGAQESKVYICLLNVYMELSDYENLQKYSLQLTQLDPLNSNGYGIYGIACFALQQQDLANKNFAIARWLGFGNTRQTLEIYVRWFQILLNQNKLEQTKDILEKFFAIHKDPHYSILIKAGEVHFNLGQYHKAIEYLTAGLNKHPKNDDFDDLKRVIDPIISNAERQNKELQQRLNLLLKDMQINPKNVKLLIIRADFEVKLQKYDESIVTNEKALKLSEIEYHRALIHTGIGMAYYHKKQYTEAIKHLNLAFGYFEVDEAQPLNKLNFDIYVLYYRIGSIYLEIGDYKNAITTFEKAKTYRLSPTVQNDNLGLLLQEAKDIYKAMSEIELIRTPSSSKQEQASITTSELTAFLSYMNLGGTFFAKSNNQDCEKYAKKAIETNPEDAAEAYYWLGTIHCEKGEYDQAIQILTKAKEQTLKKDDVDIELWRKINDMLEKISVRNGKSL